MKKKLLVMFMALILCCSLVFAIAACNTTTPTVTPSDPEEEETVDYTVANAVTAIIGQAENEAKMQEATGLNATVDNIFGVESEGMYLEASLYVEVNGTIGQLDLAMNIDDSNKNTAAFIGLSVDNVYLAQIVMDSDVIYFGDGITQEDTEWFAIDQVEGLEISSYMSAVLDVLVTLDKVGGIMGADTLYEDITGLYSTIELVLNMLMSTDIGTYSAPDGFVAGDSTTYTGDYAMTIDLSLISGLLGADFIKGIIDLGAMFEEDGALYAYSGIVDMVVEVLFGDGNGLAALLGSETMDETTAPLIELRASVDEDLALSGLGVYYKAVDTEDSEGTQVAFGIKNLYIGEADSAPANSIFPEDYDKADDIALELSLALEIPGLADDGAIELTGYIVPEFSLSWADYEITSTDEEGIESMREVSYVSVDLTGLYGFAYATYDGETIDLNVNFEELDDGMYRLSFDLSGLFSTLGYSTEGAKYYYDFDLQGVFDDMLPTGEGVVEVNNASNADDADDEDTISDWEQFYLDLDSDNAIDSIYAVIAGIVYNGFDFGSLNIGDILTSVMSVFSEVVELATDEDIFTVGDSEEVSSVAIDFTELLSALLKTSLIDDSELLEFIFDDFGGIADYLDSANIIDNLADLFGVKNIDKTNEDGSLYYDENGETEVATTKGDVMAGYICDALGLKDMDAETLGKYLLDDNLILDLFAGRDPVEFGAAIYADDGDTLLIAISAGMDIVSADDVKDIKDDMDFGGDDADKDYTGYVELNKDGGDALLADLEAFIYAVFGWTINL